MKDPCQDCLVKGCCTEICEPRFLFSVEVYRKQKASPETKRIWEENWAIFKQNDDPLKDGLDWYGEFLECMTASINLLERNEKNE